MNITKMEELTDEQFERLLEEVGGGADLGLLDPFYDPTLFPETYSDFSNLLSFSPLPSTEDQISPVQRETEGSLEPEESSCDSSIHPADAETGGANEAIEALKTANAAKLLAEEQKIRLDAMQKELESLTRIFEDIQTYQHQRLNPWMKIVQGYLNNIDGCSEGNPRSAMEDDFEIDIERP